MFIGGSFGVMITAMLVVIFVAVSETGRLWLNKSLDGLRFIILKMIKVSTNGKQ